MHTLALVDLENNGIAVEYIDHGNDGTAGTGAMDRWVQQRCDDDFLAARAAALETITLLDRLLDDLTNPEALAAMRQHLDDNPQWARRAQLFMASLPD